MNKYKDDKYFNGDIRYFDIDSATIKNVESKSVSLKGASTGMISVYDSLLIYWHPSIPNHFFNIFNVDTGEEIGHFVRKVEPPMRRYPLIVYTNFSRKGMI